jgi:hypothetical protein
VNRWSSVCGAFLGFGPRFCTSASTFYEVMFIWVYRWSYVCGAFLGVLWESQPGSGCVVVLCAVLARCFVFASTSSPRPVVFIQCFCRLALSPGVIFAPRSRSGTLALWGCRFLLQERCGTVGGSALGASDCRALLHDSSPRVIWCLRLECHRPVLHSTKLLNSLGASHSAPGAVRVVALWEPVTVAC